VGINILGGRCSIKIYSEDLGNTEYNDVGQRLNPFDGFPYMVYVPTKTKFIITSLSAKTLKLPYIMFQLHTMESPKWYLLMK